MAITYRSQTARKETLHTVSLVAPHVAPGASVLDVGCGEGYVLEELAARGRRWLCGVDVVEIRQKNTRPFRLFDGVLLPFGDRRFDVVVLSFVLHHVPDQRKCALLREACGSAARSKSLGSLGPAYNRPGADTVQDVAALFLVLWGLSAFAWAVIAREVSIQDDRVFVTRGSGRKATLSRAHIKSFHAFPFRNSYLVWMSCRPGAPIGRAIFFSHSPNLPAWPQASVRGGDLPR